MAISALRWLYLALGWAFFALGIAGVFLPVLPTTPFMLLALWGFSKSSPRLEAWLLAHRIFGPSLRDWNQHRVISWRAKAIAWTSMVASLAYLIGWRHAAPWVVIAAAALMAYGVWFMARCPSRRPRVAEVAGG